MYCLTCQTAQFASVLYRSFFAKLTEVQLHETLLLKTINPQYMCYRWQTTNRRQLVAKVGRRKTTEQNVVLTRMKEDQGNGVSNHAVSHNPS